MAAKKKQRKALERDEYGMAYGPLQAELNSITADLKETLNEYIDKRIESRLAELGLVRDPHDR
jgi:hypothetical protein